MPIPPIYFIRHGETNWNKERRLQGSRNIPLNNTGREQAKKVGAILAKHLPENLDAFTLACSPLGRVQETLQIASDEFKRVTGLPLPDPKIDPRLSEVTFGALEGKLLCELPKETLRQREENHWHFRAENGESYADGQIRAIEWLNEQSSPLIIFSHGGICRGIRAHLLQLEDQKAAKSAIPQGVVIKWDKSPSGWQEEVIET